MTLPLFELPPIETPRRRPITPAMRTRDELEALATLRTRRRQRRQTPDIYGPIAEMDAPARAARGAPIKAKRAGVNAIGKHMRQTAPIVTGRLRRSMRTRLLNRETRLRVSFNTPYANWVDLNSRRNKRYVARGARDAPRYGNRAGAPFWRFEWIRRIDRTALTKGHIFTQFRVIPREQRNG